MIVVGAIQKTLPRLRNGKGEPIFGAYLSYKTAIRRKQRHLICDKERLVRFNVHL